MNVLDVGRVYSPDHDALSWLYLLPFDFALGCFIFDQLSSFVEAYIFIILVYTSQSTHLVSQQLGAAEGRHLKTRPWVFMATAIGSGLDLYRIPEHMCARMCVTGRPVSIYITPLPLSCTSYPSIPRPAYPFHLAAFLPGSSFTSRAVT